MRDMPREFLLAASFYHGLPTVEMYHALTWRPTRNALEAGTSADDATLQVERIVSAAL